MKFSHSFLVKPDDIDEQGHVNNVAYLRWVQNVAVAHWRHAASEAQQAKFTWFVTRHEIDYKKPAFENEEITAATWVGKSKFATCERFTEITRGADLLVKAQSIWCLIDRETSRPARITPELKELFRME
ncbi:MAG TPA: thioesterase family protein [Pyrinomonadaceae bacterium]|jgi:acyl-CoA thioester hydrolase